MASANDTEKKSVTEEVEIFKRYGLKIAVKPRYKLYTSDQIINEVENVAKETSEVLDISAENCKFLLYHFKWDSLKLIEKFFDASCAKEFIKKNGIKFIFPDDIFKDDTVRIDECKMCKEIKNVAIPSCSHFYCFDCWKFVARNEKEKDDANILPYLTRNFEGCETPIPETFTLQLFNYPETRQFYLKIIIESFVHSNPLLKWCPNKLNGCELAVKIETLEIVEEEITCKCGFTFCFNCCDIPHSPFPCILVQKWKNVLQNRFENIQVKCPFCDLTEYAKYSFGCISCTKCKALSTIKDITPHLVSDLSPDIEAFETQNEILKKEFDELVMLEKVQDESVDFLKTALKLLHDFRQKFLYFYAFSYFLENQIIFKNFQSSLQFLIDNAKNLLNSPFSSSSKTSKEPPYFSKVEEQKICEILCKIQDQLNAQVNSFHKDDWKMKDDKIQKAMMK